MANLPVQHRAPDPLVNHQPPGQVLHLRCRQLGRLRALRVGASDPARFNLPVDRSPAEAVLLGNRVQRPPVLRQDVQFHRRFSRLQVGLLTARALTPRASKRRPSFYSRSGPGPARDLCNFRDQICVLFVIATRWLSSATKEALRGPTVPYYADRNGWNFPLDVRADQLAALPRLTRASASWSS